MPDSTKVKPGIRVYSPHFTRSSCGHEFAQSIAICSPLRYEVKRSQRSCVKSFAVSGRKYIYRDQLSFTNSATQRDGTKNTCGDQLLPFSCKSTKAYQNDS